MSYYIRLPDGTWVDVASTVTTPGPATNQGDGGNDRGGGGNSGAGGGGGGPGPSAQGNWQPPLPAPTPRPQRPAATQPAGAVTPPNPSSYWGLAPFPLPFRIGPPAGTSQDSYGKTPEDYWSLTHPGNKTQFVEPDNSVTREQQRALARAAGLPPELEGAPGGTSADYVNRAMHEAITNSVQGAYALMMYALEKGGTLPWLTAQDSSAPEKARSKVQEVNMGWQELMATLLGYELARRFAGGSEGWPFPDSPQK